LFALTETFSASRVKALLPDTMKLVVAAAVILGAGVLASCVPILGEQQGRLFATLKLAEIALGCLIVAWPTLWLTGSVTGQEGKALLGALLPRQGLSGKAVARDVGE
jgi:hypothetical protein